MTAISIADLNNAKLDVDHISAIANSTATSITDRFGNSKSTLSAAIDSIKAFSNRGAWIATTVYAGKDLVSVSGSWYVCVVPHTSSSAFATDTASKWRLYQGVTTGDLSAPSGASLVGYMPVGVDAIPTTVQAEFGNIHGRKIYITGAPYFCVGDGSDESAKLSAALNSGASEVVIPNGVFVGKAITITSTTLRKISGTGTLKLANGANTFLLNFTGTNECVVNGIAFDGNKTNQSGATQGTRSAYILINISDTSTVGTFINGVKFSNAYFGAVINNSGIRTSIIGNWFYDCGMVAFDGACDAIFNGTIGNSQAKIGYNYINGCSDYGIACDTSGVDVFNNTISNCFSGIGALTRKTLSAHDISANTISGCVRPIDYFNSVDDSNPLNKFTDIAIHENMIYGASGTGSLLAFSANNATLQLCQNLRIYGNNIKTETNNATLIYVSSATGSPNKGVKIYDNVLTGNASSATARYALDVNNTEDLEVHNNTFNGVDFGIALTNVKGSSRDNSFKVLRDGYGNIDNSTVSIREKFKTITRRGLFVARASVLTLDVEFDDVAYGVYIYDGSGLLPANTIYFDRLVTNGTKSATVYVDGSLSHKVVFNSEPAQVTPFVSNVIQNTWNISSPPTNGSWSIGQRVYQLVPVVGQSKGYRCTVSGIPGTWVSEGNL